MSIMKAPAQICVNSFSNYNHSLGSHRLNLISFRFRAAPICVKQLHPHSNLDNQINETRSDKFHKDLKSKLRVAYQGVPGAYSESAAIKAYPACETIPCDQFDSTFKAVELLLAEKAVLPIENSVGGSVHCNYDLLLQHKLHIVGEVQLIVNHCLLALPGVTKHQIKRVLSHPQALAQCKMTLNKFEMVRVNHDNTAGAAQIVAAKGLRDTGVIASARAANIYGLDIIQEGIQDESNNITRFLILAREPAMIPGKNKCGYKSCIVFTLDEGPGILFKALAVFALWDIKLTKIESRPYRGAGTSTRYFDYLFYIDFEASMVEPRAQNALRDLQEFTGFIRVLGSYPFP